MKTTLLASTALVLSVGAAAAADFTMADTGHDHSITLSGDARMGITNNHAGNSNSEYHLKFSSRARVQFTGAGETDGGLGFGFSFRSGDHGTTDAVDNGLAGSVFVSKGGHTLAMGDVDSAAEAAVGDVSGVGFEGLGSYNETPFDLNDGRRSNLLYSYTGGALSFHLGMANADDQIDPNDPELGDSISLGVGYDAGTFNVALGFESDEDGNDGVFLGAGADIGAFAVNLVAADSDGTGDYWAVSADFTSGATTFTVFAADNDGSDTWGLGATHDLGGGAALEAGVVDSDSEDEVIYDLGITMTF